MSLPKRPDGSIDWQIIRSEKPENWSLSESDLNRMRQDSSFSDDDFETPYLIEDISEFSTFVHSENVRKLKGIF